MKKDYKIKNYRDLDDVMIIETSSQSENENGDIVKSVKTNVIKPSERNSIYKAEDFEMEKLIKSGAIDKMKEFHFNDNPINISNQISENINNLK